jgi:hypothetical protein
MRYGIEESSFVHKSITVQGSAGRNKEADYLFDLGATNVSITLVNPDGEWYTVSAVVREGKDE